MNTGGGALESVARTMCYKLVLTEEHTEPYIFFKDEGRKDKCIVYTVQLFDEFDYLVRTRIIPLKATLLYSNGTRCTQDILALSPDSRLSIDCSGTTVIKARINAVSKGHQSQMFRIQIEEDTGDPNKFSYINPVCSVPVEVRSKRNNLKRKFIDFNQFMAGGQGRMFLDEDSYQAARHSMGAVTGGTGGTAVAALTTTAATPSCQPLFASAQARSDPRAVAPAAASAYTESKPASATAGAIETPPSTRAPSSTAPVESEAAPSARQTPAPAAAAHVTLDVAVDAVLRWAGTVMNGLQDMQWKCIGYERGADGNVDASRPLFSMSNPTQAITEIIQLYSQETMASLQALVREAEEFRRQAFIRDAMELLPSDGDDADVAAQQSAGPEPGAAQSACCGNPMAASDQALRDQESEVAVSLVSLVGGCCHASDCALSNALSAEDESKSAKNTSQSASASALPASAGSASNKSTKLDFSTSLIMKGSGSFIETFDWSNSNTEMLLGMAVNSDRQVHYIVGKIFKTSEGSIGLPAYDDAKQLIGFYREYTNCNRNIVLKYRSVNAHRGVPLASNYVALANKELEELCRESPSKVFSLPHCHDDLERMKQDALIHSWMSPDPSPIETGCATHVATAMTSSTDVAVSG